MLLFSTLLDIDDAMGKDDFIRLVIEWNQGSPHETGVIQGLNWHGERNIRYGNEKLWLDIQEYRNQNVIAVRYERIEADGVVWDTDYVMNFSSMKMAIRLYRSYTQEALFIDHKFSTPYFITLLIERGYLKDDGNLPILRSPLDIDSKKLNIVSAIVKGEAAYKLPIIYVSKTTKDEDPVNVNYLASRLKGVAHVLVQESNATNRLLQHMCNSENEYNGAIGIYYPTAAIGHRRYIYHSSIGYDSFLLAKVIRGVIQYSNAQMIDTLYTWQGVNNALLRDRLACQRQERLAAETAQKKAEQETAYLLDTLSEEERRIRECAQAENDKMLEAFDEELERLQKQVDELTRTNEVLQAENQGLKAKLDFCDSVPVLYMGDEYEFYQGEVKDLILSILSDATANIQSGSRRQHVLEDIISANDYQRISEAKADVVKKLLKNYDGMSGKLRQELKELGFDITEDGKHYKVTYYGDGRYHTVFAKTPSDHRSGKNNAQRVINMCF